MALPSYAMEQSNFAEMYEASLVGPLFRPFAEALLDRVGPVPGESVLDIACGTGIVARRAKAALGDESRVVGVDVSVQMLEVGRTAEPRAEWREGNAGALPVDDRETFDVVLCQQGLQFFPDKPLAAREMRRVLARGGKLGIATWRPVEEIPFFLELERVAERHLGKIADARYGYGDGGALERLLADAGFEDVRVETLSLTIRFPDGVPFVRLNAMAYVGMNAAAAGASEEERRTLAGVIAEESLAVLPAFADGPGIAFAVATNLATARG